MKTRSILSVVFISLFYSCRVTEDTGAMATPRTDGFYVAVNHNSKPINNLEEMKVDTTRKIVYLLRFYNNQSGVMVPDKILNNTDFNNDSTARFYFDWCKEYEIKNPRDKDYVNFKYRIQDDTLKFNQKNEQFQYLYTGLLYKDSIDLYKNIFYGNNKEEKVKNNINHLYNFSFVKVE